MRNARQSGSFARPPMGIAGNYDYHVKKRAREKAYSRALFFKLDNYLLFLINFRETDEPSGV